MRITRRLLPAVGSAVVAFALLAGCAANTVAGVGGPASSSTITTGPVLTARPTPVNPTCVAGNRPGRPTAGDPVPTPSGDPVLTVTQGSNFWIANSRTEPFAIAVYADGTAIRADAAGAYADALPGMTIGRLDPCLLADTVVGLVELASTDLGEPQITDQGTTGVTITSAVTGGSDLTISAYALGIGDEYVEPAQLVARKRLGASISTLLDGLADARPWSPESLRVTSLGMPQGDLSYRPAALRWPLDSGIASTLDDGVPEAGCGELAGEQAAAVLQVLGSAPTATAWTDGQQTVVLAIGVLVPGQPACPVR